MKTMKSKSFDLKRSSNQGSNKLNKTFDFVGLYKSAGEGNGIASLEKPKTSENLDKENSIDNTIRKQTPQSKKKKKSMNEPLDISHINIDGQNFNVSGKSSPVRESRATSTPNVSRKGVSREREPTVKSIMKTSQVNEDDAMDSSVAETSVSKPKKRNKSVSFMLDDTEEIAIKKTKSNDSLSINSKADKIKSSKKEKIKLKKIKKHKSEKENNETAILDINQPSDTQNKKIKRKVNKTISDTSPEPSSDTANTVTEKKKKVKKIKKTKKLEEGTEPSENDTNNNEEQNQDKTKKSKKKKLSKTGNSNETSEGEPARKMKKEVKPELIAEDLENLSIGDNAHTLTNLLDEMMVVDKDKKKRNKLLRKKPKVQTPTSVSSSETADLEKIDEEKEKVKWKKRKWNKDKKGDMDEQIISNSIIIDNLPLKIMCNYKKLLAEHFSQFGLIKKVGIAEMYPTEEPKPVFTTTIMFYSDGAATEALEEDNTLFEGSRIRVKRPLSPTETTLVVRSYADLTDQNLSSVFTSAGRIRSMRHLVKGKKFMATSFIEFDGPEAVRRALKVAEDAKIGGKKIHVSKFEHRTSKRKIQKPQTGSENEGDSEDSND